MRQAFLGAAIMAGGVALTLGGAYAQQIASTPGQREFQVFFDFDKSDITLAAAKVIQSAADSAKAGNLTRITVTGHTDTVGPAPYNQALSERRAAAVKRQLVADGVTDGDIAASGVGKAGLLVPTADGVREPQNRRVEIVGASPPELAPTSALPPATAAAAPQEPCTAESDPYKNYSCLDAYLGDDFFTRLVNYYKLEWGQSSAPSDPNAPPSRIDGWPTTPQSTPPMPFTEWPYGGATSIGVTRPNSVDSPFMAAISNTGVGEWLNENHFQIYGWVNAGFNVSSNTTRPGGNAPIAYAYTPNTVQLDQVVLYLDRFPDTVQTDHIDWGMRLSAIYGENYRYTTAYGIASYQLLNKNSVNGYDFPMVYGELYIPQVANGLMLRLGRYISLPDIEAQLAPNNYMYTHSMTYTFDNYTNEGLQATLAVTKNLYFQLGASVGTEAAFWHYGEKVHNPDPNPLYPANYFSKDPGAQPTLTACIRYTTDSGDDDVYGCANGINSGTWGYNNLQWYGMTYYHKFNDRWHLSYEIYDLHQDGVANLRNPTAQAAIANGGTPFSPQYIPFNAPDGAICHSAATLTCRAEALGTVAYLNYQVSPLDNISFRPEFFDDMEGQRTGTKATYLNFGLGWQHWLSPQVEMRPEIDWDRSIDAKAFNGNSNAGIAPNKNYTVIGAADLIFHF